MLDGLRVVEAADGPGIYAGRLFADLGAMVTKIAPAGWRPATAVERFYHRGKRISQAVPLADVLIEDSPVIDLAGAVRVAITPFGIGDPRQGDDLIAQAASGLLIQVGHPDRPPTQVAGRPAWHTAGAAAVAGALLALRSGGRSVDIALQEVLINATEGSIGMWTVAGQRTRRNGPNAFGGMRVIRPRRGGWAMGYVGGRWQRFLDWLEAAGRDVSPFRAPPWDSAAYRFANPTVIEDLLDDLVADLSADEVIAASRRYRLILAPVHDLGEVLANRQLRQRGFFVPLNADGPLVPDEDGPLVPDGDGPLVPDEDSPFVPGLPFTIRDGPPAEPRPAPIATAPLAGLRVLDLGVHIAAPLVGKLLAAHGADVVKVESTVHPDTMRLLALPGQRPAETMNWMWANANPGKRSITIDLGCEDGRGVFRRLVERADIVLDNFGVDPLPRFGLAYDDLVAINPRIIMLRTSVAGRGGPEADSVGIGHTIAATGGLTGATGFAGDVPCGIGTPVPDFTSSCHFGLVAVLAALHRRDRTGQGGEIDLSQVAGVAAFLAPELIAWQAGTWSASGNDDPAASQDTDATVHGVFPCQGEDRWIAISGPAAPIVALAGDRALADWTRQHDAHDLAQRLQAAGTAASAVSVAADLLADDHLATRGMFVTLPNEAIGDTVTIASHLRIDGATPLLTTPAPLLGEHTDAILAEAGYDEDAIAALYVSGALS